MYGIRNAVRTVKHAGRSLLGSDLWIRPDVRCHCEVLGNVNAQFAVHPDRIRKNPIAYSFGIGTDISFDLALLKRYGTEVHAFDPTPRSLNWLRTQAIPSCFHVHEYGVADCDGVVGFAAPLSTSHVSHSIIRHNGSERTVWAPVHRITTIMKKLGHTSIDILKMDVEGAEYGVIRDLVKDSVNVGQLCVEFHHRWKEIGVQRTREAVSLLREADYKIFHVSASGEEYSFLGPRLNS